VLVVSGHFLHLFLVHCLGLRLYASHLVRFMKMHKRNGYHIYCILTGSKPLTIVGVAHSAVQEDTRKAFQKTYPSLDPDIQEGRIKAGLLALLIDQLVDLGPLSNDQSSGSNEGNDVESIAPSE